MKRFTVLTALIALALPFGLSTRPVAAQGAPLKIVMSSTPSYTWLPFLVARSTTFADLQKKIGRPIEVTYAPTTTPAILGLIAGDYDFGIAYVQHTIEAQAEGKDLEVLLALMDNPTVAIVVRSDLDKIKTPKDLKGTSMGVVGIGSGHQMIGLAVAEAYGLKGDDVTFRSTGGISGLIPAMRAKRVDEVVASEPTLSKLVDEGLGRVLIDLHSTKTTFDVFKGPHPTVALIARRQFVDAHPKLTQEVVDAQLNALKWIHTHSTDEIAAVLPDELKKGQDVKKILARVVPAVSMTGETKPEAVMIAVGLMKQMGALTPDAKIDPAKVIDDRFLKAAH